MARRVYAKVVVILVVLGVFGAVGIYPIVAARYRLGGPSWLLDKQLKLGLDLKGGVHLVLRVQTEEAWRSETLSAIEHLRQALETAGVSFTTITSTGPAGFIVEGVSPEQAAAFRDATADVNATFTRTRGSNDAFTFAMRPDVRMKLRGQALLQARETIERRVNDLGVSEPNIAPQGRDGDEILVQLPGVADLARATSLIQTMGVLELRMVERGPSPTRGALEGQSLELGGQIADDDVTDTGDGAVQYFALGRAAVTGRDLRSARPVVDDNGLPAVRFTLSRDGGVTFGKATAGHLGRELAIVLDGHIRSVARIENVITTDGLIHGRFTPQEAQDLAIVLRSGSLDAPLSIVEEQTIGPSLGADAVRAGMVASIVGLLLVVLFMLAYYRRAGVNAVIALVLNLVIVLGWMAYLGVIVTLPGIAGFVLTMGVGVDSSVLVFERIKEERAAGRSVRASIDAGFRRVFVTLVDTHLAALVATAFLFQFGTGPVRGFAVTLAIGLLSNLFTSTFASRSLFELGLSWRPRRSR